MNRSFRAALAVITALAIPALSGCAPKIGSKCVLNTDCGTSGALVCDTSEPGGYCTQFNCTPNSCQDHAVCVELRPSVPGCPYDDYRSPSRTGRTFCLEHCNQSSDCNEGDGYVCADPRQPPWSGAITDDDQSQKVCIIAPDPGTTSPLPVVGDSALPTLPDGSVCSPSGPLVPPIGVSLGNAGEAGPDAGAPDGGDGGGDAAVDAARDATLDATLDGGMTAGTDAAIDGGATADDGGAASAGDGGPDAPAADGQGGG